MICLQNNHEPIINLSSNMLAWKLWQRDPYSWKQKAYVCKYYQECNYLLVDEAYPSEAR